LIITASEALMSRWRKGWNGGAGTSSENKMYCHVCGKGR
jgi:hypothetical protein